MPLSEHEQRLLAEMERQLNDDPQFTDSLRKVESAGRFSTRNIAVGLLIAVVGLAAVLVGISLSQARVVGVIVGVLGFFLMCLGVYFAATKRKGQGGASAAGAPRPGRPAASGYMQRLEQQWDDRRRNEGQ